jgi:hypothetical protein
VDIKSEWKKRNEQVAVEFYEVLATLIIPATSHRWYYRRKILNKEIQGMAYVIKENRVYVELGVWCL